MALTLQQLVDTGWKRYVVEGKPFGYEVDAGGEGVCVFCPSDPYDADGPHCILGASMTLEQKVAITRNGDRSGGVYALLAVAFADFGNISKSNLMDLQDVHDDAAQMDDGDNNLSYFKEKLWTFCDRHDLTYPGDVDA